MADIFSEAGWGVDKRDLSWVKAAVNIYPATLALTASRKHIAKLDAEISFPLSLNLLCHQLLFKLVFPVHGKSSVAWQVSANWIELRDFPRPQGSQHAGSRNLPSVFV